MEDGNVRFSMERKGQCSRILFCVKITQFFICHQHSERCYCIPFQKTRALFYFSSTADENTDTVLLIEEFVC